MSSPAFCQFFEIFAEGVVMTVAAIATAAFAERCWKRSVPLNSTGLGASVVALFYSVYGLNYWFNGMSGYNCTALAAVNGGCMSVSNALTYLHLFVKADVSNRSNPMWCRFYRWVGVATTLFNWGTLVAVHALLRGEEIDGIDGPRCQFIFEMTTFKLKWVAQFINQAFQVVAFVWPLMIHLKRMGNPSLKGGDKDSVFRLLVQKALIASGVSLVFTAIVSGLAFTKVEDMRRGDNSLVIPVFPLAVLDNAVNLGAIMFAVHISAGSREESVGRRSIHGITSGASNVTASVPDKMGLTGARGVAAGSSHSHISPTRPSRGSISGNTTPKWSRHKRADVDVELEV